MPVADSRIATPKRWAASEAVVVGTGTIACACLNTLHSLGIPLRALESEGAQLSLVFATCKKLGVAYERLVTKREISHFFSTIAQPTLVVSANNNYLFPAAIVSKSNVRIINFHNALLPRHRGRNAPTWAIFEMDSVHGVTWHEVTAGIDEGAIVAQSEIQLSEKITALELTKRCMTEAASVFTAIAESLVAGTYSTYSQPSPTTLALHHSSDVPNGGVINLEWPAAKLSAFLRSVDFGAYAFFPKPRCMLNGRDYFLQAYELHDGAENRAPGIRFDGTRYECSDGRLTVVLTLEAALIHGEREVSCES